jgi:phosphatidylserine decarboxylase
LRTGFVGFALWQFGLIKTDQIAFDSSHFTCRNNIGFMGPGQELIVTKGQKLGHFAYGGSMVVLLFEKYRMRYLSVQQGLQIGLFSN